MNLSYGETDSDQAPLSNTVGSEMGSSMLYEAYVFNPTYPIYNEEGDYYDVPPLPRKSCIILKRIIR